MNVRVSKLQTEDQITDRQRVQKKEGAEGEVLALI